MLAGTVLLLLSAAAPSADERSECVCLLDSATSATVGAVRIFEGRRPESPGAVAAAERALIAASDARDALEAAHPSAACRPSWNEELVYVNHLIPGFRGWLDARLRPTPEGYDVSSIIRRARVHPARGRAPLR